MTAKTPQHTFRLPHLLALALALAGVGCGSKPAPPSTPPAPGRAAGTLAGHDYLTFVTAGARETDALPLVIGLHYSGATPEAIAADFDQIDFPVRVVLPRGKHPRPTGASWFPKSYGELAAADQAPMTLEVEREVLAFVDAAARHFPTAGKPVLAGTSYGGDLSYLIAIHHPDRIAAAFPVAARFPVEWNHPAAHCGAHCPLVYAMHGDRDRVVPIEGGRLAAQQLAALGHRVELHEYAGVEHDFAAQMKADFTTQLRALLAP